MRGNHTSARLRLGVLLCIGIFGLIMSVLLHELFHVFMHWGDIVSVHLFPDLYTIVAIESHATLGYNVAGEELIAYGITLVVLLTAADLMVAFCDATDQRSSRDILCKPPELAALPSQEYFELMQRIKL